jgi:hypothetical protein
VNGRRFGLGRREKGKEEKEFAAFSKRERKKRAFPTVLILVWGWFSSLTAGSTGFGQLLSTFISPLFHG